MRDFLYFIVLLLLSGAGIAYWQSNEVEIPRANPHDTKSDPPAERHLSDDQLRNAFKQRWQDKLDSIVIGSFEWKLKTQSMAVYASFTIKNYLLEPIKDVEVVCEFFGKSGTRIVSRSYTVYDFIKPKSTLPIKNVFLGTVPDQVASAACRTAHFGSAKGVDQTTP